MEFITVRDFVQSILQTLPKPYGADLVEQVFLAIESNEGYRQVYDDLVKAHGEHIAKNSIGLNIAGLTGMKNSGRTQPSKSSLIENYSELEPDPTHSGIV